jgi:hypothetical protein
MDEQRDETMQEQPYEPPRAEDLETAESPAVTAAGGTDNV